MGQLVSSADLRGFVEANVQSFVAQVTGPYSRLFGQSPTFVTYYSQDLAQGSTDTNLGGSLEFVGPESSLRYKRVDSFPLYGIGQMDVSTAYDDVQGSISGNVQGEAHLLPGTLEPYENDLFTVDYLETTLLFRCRQVDADRIEGKAFFKLQWFLDQANPVDLPAQTTESYQFEIANVGSNVSPLVESSLALLLRQLAVVEEALKTAYYRAFYDRTCSSVILRDSMFSRAVHDRAVDLFVSNQDLLSTNAYLGVRRVVPADYSDRGYFEDVMYPTTIYWASENARDWPDVDGQLTNLVDLMPARALGPESQFYALSCLDGMTEAIPVAADDGTPNYFIGGSDFFSLIDAAGPRYYGDSTTYSPGPMRALAQRCLNGCYRPGPGDDAKPLAATFVADLNNAALLANRVDLFWLGPIAMMEAKLLRQYATATSN